MISINNSTLNRDNNKLGKVTIKCNLTLIIIDLNQLILTNNNNNRTFTSITNNHQRRRRTQILITIKNSREKKSKDLNQLRLHNKIQRSQQSSSNNSSLRKWLKIIKRKEECWELNLISIKKSSRNCTIGRSSTKMILNRWHMNSRGIRISKKKYRCWRINFPSYEWRRIWESQLIILMQS